MRQADLARARILAQDLATQALKAFNNAYEILIESARGEQTVRS
jgi:hypothetical protein